MTASSSSAPAVTTRTIYCDAGKNARTGRDAWASVVEVVAGATKGTPRDILKLAGPSLFRDLSLKRVSLPTGPRTIAVVNFGGVSQQNNGGELVALVAGLRYAITRLPQSSPTPAPALAPAPSELPKLAADAPADVPAEPERVVVATDSDLLFSWWSRGRVNSATRQGFSPEKSAFMDEVIRLRSEFEDLGGEVIRVPGAENPADLGYHRESGSKSSRKGKQRSRRERSYAP